VTRPTGLVPAGYDTLIERHARDKGVRPELVKAVIQIESAFNPRAVSPKGALGLMQLMPATAVALGVTDAFDPDENIRAGVSYLQGLLARYRGKEELALAAYNAGPAAVDRYGARVPPYPETRRYVRQVRARTVPTHSSAGSLIYKTHDAINGRNIPHYSNIRPASGEFEVVEFADRSH